jgi:lipopolysaccharide/colanic/teichoic acid biosynthesis glycosyltransferase
VKRALDLIVATIAGAVLSPVVGAIALGVRLRMGRPVLFSQERLGHGGRRFAILKFRTMTDARGADGALEPDERRLTRLGRFLRSSSLDELPELVNVLRGEMSLVGPRPWMAQYEGMYSPEEFRRHDVLPGITGWAQVNGRNALSWDDRFALDLWYVDHWSLPLDLRILVRTLGQVFRRRGIAHGDHATSPLFARERPEEPKA